MIARDRTIDSSLAVTRGERPRAHAPVEYDVPQGRRIRPSHLPRRSESGFVIRSIRHISQTELEAGVA
jgi:hypothetical protein